MQDNTKLPTKNEAKQQSAMTKSANQSERESKQGAMADFEESVMLLVLDSYAMSSQIITMEEKMVIAKVWARLLFDTIPENRLQECFDYARAHHDSSFAVTGYEIEAAYREIQKQSETGMEHYSAAAMENIRRVAEENRLHEEWRVKKIREEHDANRHNYRNAH